MITVRREISQDIPQIHELNTKAFGQPTEAKIVDRLRKRCPDILSLVAVDNRSIVGHLLFSPVIIEDAGAKSVGMGLAPMAVLPGHQRQGIGSILVRKGLQLLGDRGCPYVIVLGHPEFYPRFGFEPASKYGIACQWPGVPDEAFMVLELMHNALANTKGTARYRDEFNEAMRG